MRRARVVAGAISEGDPEEDEAGNAGSWLDLVLMLEEVGSSPWGVCSRTCRATKSWPSPSHAHLCTVLGPCMHIAG